MGTWVGTLDVNNEGIVLGKIAEGFKLGNGEGIDDGWDVGTNEGVSVVGTDGINSSDKIKLVRRVAK